MKRIFPNRMPSGVFVVAVACPLFNRITKRERERLAPEIWRFAEELSRPE